MQKHFLALCCFFCFFLTQTASSSSSSYSVKDKKLAEFQARIQDISAPNLPPAAPGTKRVAFFMEVFLFLFLFLLFLRLCMLQSGRVFYPIGYGADPSGVEESCEAFLQALEEAFQVQKGLEMLPGVNDLGGLIVDLQGGNYKISKPIRFPPSGGGNIVVSALSLITILLKSQNVDLKDRFYRGYNSTNRREISWSLWTPLNFTIINRYKCIHLRLLIPVH